MKLPSLLISIICLMIFTTFNATAHVPEFGKSVKFEKGKAKPILANLKQKTVMIIFCQEWCPLCNKWTGNVLPGMAKKYKDNPNCQVIALKTDGNINSLKKYLKKRDVDYSNWVLGEDKKGIYEGQLMNQRGALWIMAIIPPNDGPLAVIKIGTSSLSDPKDFKVLRDDQIEEWTAGSTPVLSNKYTKKLQSVVEAAELCQYNLALKRLSKKKASVSKVEIAKLKKDITDSLSAQIKKNLDIAKDKSKASSDRYDALLKLVALKNTASKISTVPAVLKLASTLLKSPELNKEIQAHKAYKDAFQKFDNIWFKNKIKEKPYKATVASTIKKLQVVSKKYPDTKFGKQAMTQIKRMKEKLQPS